MKIHGAGCCLVDSIYLNCRYDDERFAPFWSKNRGDGGLIEGGLVFSEDLESYTGERHFDIIKTLSAGRAADKENIGGPAVVALIHAAQVLASENAEVSFYGAIGDDERATLIRKALSTTPLHYSFKPVENRLTPTTEVFDDPSRKEGKGERLFVNTIGAAWDFAAKDLPDDFFNCDILLLGGTALVPRLHDDLFAVLHKAKEKGTFTVVGTVFDFRNEKKNPNGKWPLGSKPSYSYIDLLVADEKEALRLTGTEKIDTAVKKLIDFGVGAFIITRGSLPMIVWSSGKQIEALPVSQFPVSKYIDRIIEANPSLRKDTTGCGDNFLGGVLVAIAKCRNHETGMIAKPISMKDICAWGASSGGLTLTYYGGMFYENFPGEKLRLLEPIVKSYYHEQETLP